MMLQNLWKIKTDQISPQDYFGVMVANGMIGAISDQRPLHVKEVVLNGVYDRYRRGRDDPVYGREYMNHPLRQLLSEKKTGFHRRELGFEKTMYRPVPGISQ